MFPRPGLYNITNPAAYHSSLADQSEEGWEIIQPIRSEEADDTEISDIMTTVNIGHLPVTDPRILYFIEEKRNLLP